MSKEYNNWFEEEHCQQLSMEEMDNLSGTDEDLELWTVIMEMSDFIKKRGAQVLIDNLPREVYDPIAKHVHNEYARMQLKVMSANLQREAIAKDSY